MSEPAKKEVAQSEQVTPIQQSPDNWISEAITQGSSVETLERLMALKEKWDAQQAKSAFYSAMQRFQSECPVIRKTKKVEQRPKSGGTIKYSFAPLQDIDAQIKELMKDCGLTKRWEIDSSIEGWVTVECIISHFQGHSESTKMTVPADDSGGKGKVQQYASSVSYAQRYTLIGALGITTADEDMDGRLPADAIEYVSEEQAANITALIDEVGADKDKMLKYFGADSVEAIPSKEYSRVIKALEKKRSQ